MTSFNWVKEIISSSLSYYDEKKFLEDDKKWSWVKNWKGCTSTCFLLNWLLYSIVSVDFLNEFHLNFPFTRATKFE